MVADGWTCLRIFKARDKKEADPTGGRGLRVRTSHDGWTRRASYGFSVATKSARSPDGVLTTSVTSTEKLFSRSRLRS